MTIRIAVVLLGVGFLAVGFAGCAALSEAGKILGENFENTPFRREDTSKLTLISSEENTAFSVKYRGSSRRAWLGKGKILTDVPVADLRGAEVFAKPEGYKERHVALGEHPGSSGLRFTFEISDREDPPGPEPTPPPVSTPTQVLVVRPRPLHSTGVLPTETREEVLAANRWKALLIGISQYRNPEWRLNTPSNDVRVLASILESDYGFKTTVIENENATLEGIRRAIDALRSEIGTNDNVLLYYAGHGLFRSSGVGYWLPSDAMSDVGGIPYSEIKELLENLPARRVLLVSDACFSGPFVGRRGVGVREEPPKTPQESVQVSVKLARNLNSSREVITSGNMEEVPDSGRGFLAGHSPFLGTLLICLEKVPVGAAIGTTDLYSDLKQNLHADPSLKQRPQLGTLPGHGNGEFFMVRVRRGSATDR